MNTTVFHILLALAEGDTVAVEIWRQIRIDTEGTYYVPERTFYAALPVLVKREWLVRQGEGRGARYRLTPMGRKQLLWEGARVKRAAELLRQRL